VREKIMWEMIWEMYREEYNNVMRISEVGELTSENREMW
jgi:hypothetical protein